MKMTKMRKALSFILCMVLIAAMALVTTGCNDKKEQETAQKTVMTTELQMIGEGETVFSFTVTDKDGAVSEFEVHTDKTTVGEALMECGLLEGEAGAYGLYVKKVNGITADYDVDQTYWAFYINDEYAVSGVDTTEIEEGKTYAFKVER